MRIRAVIVDVEIFINENFSIKIALCYEQNSPLDVPTYTFGQEAVPLRFVRSALFFLNRRDAAANQLSFATALVCVYYITNYIKSKFYISQIYFLVFSGASRSIIVRLPLRQRSLFISDCSSTSLVSKTLYTSWNNDPRSVVRISVSL